MTTISQPAPQSATDTRTPWEKMLTQVLMAQKMGLRGMSGFALGQILAALLKQWKSNYDYRGDMRKEWEPLTPEERSQQLARLRQQNPAKADEAEKFVRERWGENAFGAQPQIPAQPQQTQAIPQISAPISQSGQQIMPNIDFQNQQPQLLGNPEDWENLARNLEMRRMRRGVVNGF